MDVTDFLKNGDTFLKLGDFVKAKEAYEEATKADPADYRGWVGQFAAVTDDYKMFCDNSCAKLMENAIKVAAPEQKQTVEEIFKPHKEKLGTGGFLTDGSIIKGYYGQKKMSLSPRVHELSVTVHSQVNLLSV